jgi:hypothetical protein
MKKISKLLFSLIALSLMVLPITVSALTNAEVGLEGTNSISGLKLSNREPIAVATELINAALMFLGLIAVVIFLVGGFKWMTAMGSDDNIKKAKELMSAGVVGLIIILASWGIAKFVLSKLISTI